MTIYALMGVALILFVLGVIYILRGSREEKNIVPISEIKDIRAMNIRTADSANVSLMDHLMRENLSSKGAGKSRPLNRREEEFQNKIVELSKELEVLQGGNNDFLKQSEEKIIHLSSENVSLKESLSREIEAQKRKEAESLEQGGELAQAKRSIESLHLENAQLTQELQDNKKRFSEIEDVIEKTKRGHEQALEIERAKTKAMERELSKLDELSQKYANDRLLLEELRVGNKDLVKKHQAGLEEILQLQQEILLVNKERQIQHKNYEDTVNQIKKENQGLLLEMGRAEQKLKQMQEDFEFLKKTNQQKLEDAQQVISGLQKELNDSEAMRKQFNEIVHRKTELEAEYQKMKEYNDKYLHREGGLQYEVTKARAQVLGLERICEDFKLQIEEIERSREAAKS